MAGSMGYVDADCVALRALHLFYSGGDAAYGVALRAVTISVAYRGGKTLRVTKLLISEVLVSIGC